MDKNENVFITLQIEKNRSSGDLMLVLSFDKNAPNFSMDGDTIRWAPTFEELDLVMETYEITSKKKNRVERCDEEVRNTVPYPHSDEQKEVSSSDEPSEQKIATFEPLEENVDVKESLSDPVLDKKDDGEGRVFAQVDEAASDPVLDKKDDGEGRVFAQVDEDASDPVLDKKGDEGEVFVQVDERTIEAALEKKRVGVGEALILDKDDKSIIDRMLKKKEKDKDEI